MKELLRQNIQTVLHASFAGILLVLIAGNAPAQSTTAKKPAPVIQGDSIRGDPITPPAPAVAAAVSTNAAAVAVTPAKKTAKGTNDFVDVDFEDLAAYEFAVPDAWTTNITATVKQANKQIPATISALDGKKVAITGFMFPVKMDKGEINQFMLLRSQSLCCYGVMPKITEWVTVNVKGHGLETQVMDEPITVKGKLHVGAVVENHTLVDIYEMDGVEGISY